MCAIAGIFRYNSLSYDPLSASCSPDTDKILFSMRRRGPDDRGSFSPKDAPNHAPLTLYHTRLSVIDPDGGKQPMLFYDGETIPYAIVYNGELYNTPELKAELIRRGHTFLTHTDTEVVLHSYIEWKEKCLERMNGIFAFAVWDAPERKLFLARDRMGVKPLFFIHDPERFIFASEIKTLFAFPNVNACLDSSGIAELMLLGPGRTPGCGVFKGVRELAPAEYAVLDAGGQLHIHRYWKLTAHPHDLPFSETKAAVSALVRDAIRRQLVSDVPIGTFLSGGLDSSLISSAACDFLKEEGKHLTTFSVDYRDNDRYFRPGKFQPQSDSGFIPLMQRFLSEKDPLCSHHLITLDTPALADALSDAVDARDLPGMADIDSSLLLFCKEIRREVTVALSGECADELFGGYPWYRDPEIREKAGFPWAQTTGWRSSFIRPEILSDLDPEQFMSVREKQTLSDTDTLPTDSPLERRMRQMMRLNTDWFMQTLLDRKDRMSMYWGLEVRVPFCDYRIAEYLYNVPWEQKEWGGYEKGLLRKAVEDLLPPEVLWRKKSPYPKTHHPGYRAAVSRLLREILSDYDPPLLRLVRRKALEQLLTDDSAIPWYGQLMTAPQTIAYMVQLNDWLKKWKPEIRF